MPKATVFPGLVFLEYISSVLLLSFTEKEGLTADGGVSTPSYTQHTGCMFGRVGVVLECVLEFLFHALGFHLSM